MCLSLNGSVLTSGGDSVAESLGWTHTHLAWNPSFAIELLSDCDAMNRLSSLQPQFLHLTTEGSTWYLTGVSVVG